MEITEENFDDSLGCENPVEWTSEKLEKVKNHIKEQNSKRSERQKITTIDYFDNIVNISLTRDEWNSSITWVSSLSRGTERAGENWFKDLLGVLYPISDQINSHNKNYSFDEAISCRIPRALLRYFVYSIGRISYDLDCKYQTSMKAQVIIIKINHQLKEQLSEDDEWFKCNF